MIYTRSFKRFILLALVLTFSSQIQAVTLTFDDVPGGSVQNSTGPMPTYNGFSFSSTLHWVDVEGPPSWDFGAHSGDFSILNNYGGVGTIIDAGDSDFTFDGVWAKRWNTSPNSGGADSLFGTISGYNNGGEVWSVNTSLNGSYEFYAAQLGLIDELRMDFGSGFLVDDLSLNGLTSPSAVPVPAAVWLFGTALIGLVGFGKRRKAA
jgi:hypothetical protein